MEKLPLDVDELVVTPFGTVEHDAEADGTVLAHSTADPDAERAVHAGPGPVRVPHADRGVRLHGDPRRPPGPL